LKQYATVERFDKYIRQRGERPRCTGLIDDLISYTCRFNNHFTVIGISPASYIDYKKNYRNR
jgi:hypothetical protein